MLCGFIAVCRQDFNYHILRGVIISTTSSAKLLKPIDRHDGVDPWDQKSHASTGLLPAQAAGGLSDSARKEQGKAATSLPETSACVLLAMEGSM